MIKQGRVFSSRTPVVPYSLILIVASIFLALTFLSQLAMAQEDEVTDYPVGTSYFEKQYVGYDQLIEPDELGANSLRGSVMPNWHSSKTTRGTAGAGAVGTRALGIHSNSDPSGTTASNRARKQALFCFLQKKNGVALSSRHSSCAGRTWDSTTDWEKMGSALIVHQMLKKNWGQGTRQIDAADWVELYTRLVENDDLLMTRSDYDWAENTAGVIVNGNYDAIRWRYTYSYNVDAWVFHHKSGRTVYALEIICANPLGGLGGLDPYKKPEEEKFSLNPTAAINKSVVEADDKVEVTNTVTNQGTHVSKTTLWRLTRMIYSPGTSLSSSDKGGRDSRNDPCGSFRSGNRSNCETVQESTESTFNPGVPRTFSPKLQYVIPADMPVGTIVCFTASVSRPTQENSPVWRHSALQCVMVGKKPKVQIWGGDVRSGSKIETSVSTITSLNTTYGSWGEYAALSMSTNRGLATGSGLNNGSGSSSQSSWSNLTFANIGTPSGCNFGCYNFSLSAPTIAGQFISSSNDPRLTGTVNLADKASGTYRANTNITLTGATISAGKTITILSTATVTIDGSILYEDRAYENIRDIPQLIIRAPTINIRNEATQVDAWLLAVDGVNGGRLNTCSNVSVTARLTTGICNNKLTINGPVVADTVYLRRTAGAEATGDARGEPAEIFNLRADAYLWARANGSGTSRVQTVHTKELSPRF